MIEVEYVEAALDLAAARARRHHRDAPRRARPRLRAAPARVAFDPPVVDTFAFITRRNAHLSPATPAFMELASEARWRRRTRIGPCPPGPATVAEQEYLETIFWLYEAGCR